MGGNITVTIPPTENNTTTGYQLPPAFHIINEAVNENQEIFALVAEVGPDTPDRMVCFQRRLGDTTCHGRLGATQIEIIDNDGRWLTTLVT